MRNYAEELAYWYFRFNGFFLLNNYVSHPGDRNDASHSDSDLLAVRIGKPHEKVGIDFTSIRRGVAPCDTLEELIHDCLEGREHGAQEIIGIICEVKAGANTYVGNQNLVAQLLRFGFVNELNLEATRNGIIENGFYLQENGFLIIRILVSVEGVEQDGFNGFAVEELLEYIRLRFDELRNEKEGGWVMFDSTLIQFLLKEHVLYG